ncbi:MAG TPA: hypothetical protein PK079_24355 [Leptospiraceae bacterium]|nr:hypothetical protein [Leptospiraceae bacterium]HMW03699.1 hypothetical protein [Leptospiraceae bacterium]HMX35383.1 hypothetical protein [Leptospiraceae bacterium]HMY29679.1 hypothetical protein [Leptospiraceae bacterium]HMZ64045.1 hypothetical protein [Leptospiraceae bacterium]
MKNILLKNWKSNLIVYTKIYAILISTLFITCEIDFERNWCQEKLENREYAADPVFTLYTFCSIREKKNTESQEEYDAYVRNRTISCKESANLQILNYYLENQKKEECKKINRLLPTIHELTM